MKPTTAILTGRCSSGEEKGRGTLHHVAEVGGFDKAFCGIKPGRLTSGWAKADDNLITCERCLKRWLIEADPVLGTPESERLSLLALAVEEYEKGTFVAKTAIANAEGEEK